MLTVLATLDGQPLLLAQDVTATGDDTAQTQESGDESETSGGGGFDPMIMMLIFGMVILWIFLLGGGSRKQRKKQQALLATMSKGSKIVTIGGIKGSVVEIRENEVIVKVDENNNTRMHFSRDAIRSVNDESAKQDGKDSKDASKDDKDKK